MRTIHTRTVPPRLLATSLAILAVALAVAWLFLRPDQPPARERRNIPAPPPQPRMASAGTETPATVRPAEPVAPQVPPAADPPAPVSAEDPSPGAAGPTRLEASLEGFMGPSYKVSIGPRGTVLYQHNARGFIAREGTTSTELAVTPQQWAAFRSSLDAAGVWSWKKTYDDNPVPDGTVWKFNVEWPDARAFSSGRNAYPDSRSFELFRAAVRELIGGREFR